MSSEVYLPRVPDELTHLLDDQVQDVQRRWASYDFDDVRAMMPEPQVIDLPNDRQLRGVVLEPATPERDEACSLVLALPFCQAWKPSMFIRAEVMRQIIAPNSRLVVFPNNSITDEYYDLTEAELGTMHEGSMAPLAELQARALEVLKVGEAAVSGYSLGGVLAIELAAVGSDKLEICHINADETPNKERTSKQLQKDFLASGGWGEQRRAIEDAEVPALEKALNVSGLALDYARFGVASLRKTNKALHLAMAGSLVESIKRAKTNYPEASLKLGYVLGSKLFDLECIGEAAHEIAGASNGRVSIRDYSGDGAHMHSTGDNPYAHALMVVDGLVN